MKKKSARIDVRHLAKLVNLSLTKEEVKRYSRQLTEVLDYISQLREIDTSKIKPTSRTVDLANITFNDGKEEKQTLASLKGLKSKIIGGKRYFIAEKIL